LLAPIAVALLAIGVRGTSPARALLIGAVQGLIAFGILLRWLTVVGPDAWILLSALCAAWIALMAVTWAVVSKLAWWPLWYACLWVAQEALRDRIPLGGFPWGRLAFAQTATTLTPWAAVGGAALVTFATALAGTLLAYVVIAWRSGQRSYAAAAAGAVLALAISGLLIPRPVGGDTTQPLAVIQGGVPSTGLSVTDERREVFNRHIKATLDLAEQIDRGESEAPIGVIWPENSVDIDPARDVSVSDALDAAVRAVGAPILIGAVVDVDETFVANMGIVWGADGPSDRYIKRHPVPFGEYVPFRALLTSVIGRFALIPRDFVAGGETGVLDLGGVTIGDVICFEVAYDDIVRDVVVQGGQVIVVQTNNATFAGLGQPEQQIAMSRLRAVEHGRAVLVAATSGISAVIGPDGSVEAEMGEGASGDLVAMVPLRTSLTVADRLGELPEFGLALAGFVAVVIAAIAGRRVPRTTTGTPRLES
jgi:apolipoprotein N-acyltransferase